ncbi:MAG: hypothetical protein U0704_16405 [Candidatus Eisenbacteria bacterium]
MTTTPAPQAPPFCPNPRCPFHAAPHGWRYQRDGHHCRLAPPHRVQRYRCCHCRRRFSDQTFRTTYWLKRPELLLPVFHGLLSCSCLRQLARAQECSPQTVLLHANRLGRHCQLFHEQLRPRGGIPESVAMDGFFSFEYSQYHPTSYNVLVGRRSYFLYGFTATELRRSGSMTRAQKAYRKQNEARLGRPDPRATEKDCAELLAIAAPEPQALELHTDEHQDYPRAIARVAHLNIAHHTVSSRAARTTSNPIFSVNLNDMVTRHSDASHKRETIAFAKRRQMSIWRMAVFLVWRNYMKWASERRHQDTPAMRLGITDHRLTPKEVLARRLFPGRVKLPERWSEYYWGRVQSREVPNGRQHTLRYAA